MKNGKSRNVKIAFSLKDDERKEIQSLLNKGKKSVRVIKRAQVLNLFDTGYTSPKIADFIKINVSV